MLKTLSKREASQRRGVWKSKEKEGAGKFLLGGLPDGLKELAGKERRRRSASHYIRERFEWG